MDLFNKQLEAMGLGNELKKWAWKDRFGNLGINWERWPERMHWVRWAD